MIAIQMLFLRWKRGEYQELRKVEKGELAAEKSPVIRKYQQQGLFHPNIVTAIRHPQTDILEHNAGKRLSQLILQVTQQCNLRCEYCAYSGIYEGNRTHANKNMDFETAKQAIDFFLAHSTENAESAIGFYGGEPLLRFDLIKKCVDYLEASVEGKKLQYVITTNGTLLTEDKMSFFVQHDFSLSISLDGSKEEHDACRKFPNGEGSFDIIINNIKKFEEKYPEYVKEHVRFMTTVNPYMNLGCVLEYFKTSDVINDTKITYNGMSESNLKEETHYQESYYMIRRFEYMKTLLMLIGKLEEQYVSRLMSSTVDNAIRKKKSLHQKKEIGYVEHHGGPCQPGVMRLFVNVAGNFYPCEKTSEEIEFYRIGSLKEGFLIDKMEALLNIGQWTEQECIDCWNLRHCLICANQIELNESGKLCRECKLKKCADSKDRTEFELYEQCVLKEFGYELDVEVM